MTEKAPVFEKIYKDYLTQVAGTDIRERAGKLGIQTDGDDILIPFFGKPYKISPAGILDPSGKQPNHAVTVIFCKYILLCPDKTDDQDSPWVSYRDFKDAAPFAAAFANNTEQAIAENFSGRLEELKNACRQWGGTLPDIRLSYDLSVKFDALPKVPLLLLFNDADDEFPAQCSVLFEKRAETYLDMECLAMAGWLLAGYLSQAIGIMKTAL